MVVFGGMLIDTLVSYATKGFPLSLTDTYGETRDRWTVCIRRRGGRRQDRTRPSGMLLVDSDTPKTVIRKEECVITKASPLMSYWTQTFQCRYHLSERPLWHCRAEWWRFAPSRASAPPAATPVSARSESASGPELYNHSRDSSMTSVSHGFIVKNAFIYTWQVCLKSLLSRTIHVDQYTWINLKK